MDAARQKGHLTKAHRDLKAGKTHAPSAYEACLEMVKQRGQALPNSAHLVDKTGEQAMQGSYTPWKAERIRADIDILAYPLPNAKGGFAQRARRILRAAEKAGHLERFQRERYHTPEKSSGTPVFKVSTQQGFFHGTEQARRGIFEENRCLTLERLVIGSSTLDLKSAVDFSKANSFAYVAGKNFKAPPARNSKPEIQVVLADSLDHALALKKQNLTPLLLDFANATKVCGGAETGRGNAQEEAMTYRSNLYNVLLITRRARLPKKPSCLNTAGSWPLMWPYSGRALAKIINFTTPEKLDIYAAAALSSPQYQKS